METKYRILFPCHNYNLKQVDEAYATEARTCDTMGIKYYLFDYDTFVDCGEIKHNIDLSEKCTLIYRGWMMKPNLYDELDLFIYSQSNLKIQLINNNWRYTNCHCFPNVYPDLRQYTPRIQVLENWGDIYTTDINFDFFIKDYVKSCKTTEGVEKLSRNIYKDELVDKIAQFVKERGKLFTGNIVLKEFVDLKKIKGKTNEWRAFYLYGERISLHQNSYLDTNIIPPTNLIEDIGIRIGHYSNFFTVDFALTEQQEWIVIETGDGQVSGLPTGEELNFYNNLFFVLDNPPNNY